MGWHSRTGSDELLVPRDARHPIVLRQLVPLAGDIPIGTARRSRPTAVAVVAPDPLVLLAADPRRTTEVLRTRASVHVVADASEAPCRQERHEKGERERR